MAHGPISSLRRLSPLGWLAAITALAACSLDFDSFSYPNVVVTSSTSASSSGSQGGGGVMFTSSSSGGSGGSTATAGGSSSGGSGGAGGECGGPGDCPQGDECEQATCVGNTCGLENKPIGDPCSNGGNICDGQGSCYLCQSEPFAATGGMNCPSECSSCNDTDNNFIFDECVVDCGATTCITVNCPAGFSCRVQCTSNDCSGVIVNCPAGEDCTVDCNGSQGNTAACAGTIINCDQSNVCALSCQNQGCNNSTNLLCGNGRCIGNCESGAVGTLNCSNTCWCDSGQCTAQ